MTDPRAAAAGPSPPPFVGASPSVGDEARAFLQDRLAFLGKAYGLIAISFFLAGNLIASRLPEYRRTDLFSVRSSRLVLGASVVYLLQWRLCRRGRWPETALLAIDGTSTTLAALGHSLMVFAPFHGEA